MVWVQAARGRGPRMFPTDLRGDSAGYRVGEHRLGFEDRVGSGTGPETLPTGEADRQRRRTPGGIGGMLAALREVGRRDLVAVGYD